jgi:hypothetical protein
MRGRLLTLCVAESQPAGSARPHRGLVRGRWLRGNSQGWLSASVVCRPRRAGYPWYPVSAGSSS